MKLSKLIHVLSIVSGIIGVIAFVGAILGGTDNTVFGITKVDALLCSGILILVAIWLQVAVIHHMMLEKKGEVI